MANFKERVLMARKIELERREQVKKNAAAKWLEENGELFESLKDGLIESSLKDLYSNTIKYKFPIDEILFKLSHHIEMIEYIFFKNEGALVNVRVASDLVGEIILFLE